MPWVRTSFLASPGLTPPCLPRGPLRLPGGGTEHLRAPRSEAREWVVSAGSRSLGPLGFGLEFLGRRLSTSSAGASQLERPKPEAPRAPLVLGRGAGSGDAGLVLGRAAALEVVPPAR